MPVATLLSRYMDDDLSDAEKDRLESALAADPDMRAQLRRMQGARRLLREAMPPEKPPAEVLDALMAIGRPEEPPDVPIELLVQRSRSAQLDVAGRSKKTKRRKRRKS